MSAADPHIGLVGGIGPAATDLYHRGLIRAAAARGAPLELTIAYADAGVLIRHQGADDRAAQAAIFATLIERLARAGATAAAVTSIAGHFCIDETKAAAALPMVDLLDALDAALTRRSLSRVGVLGTAAVMSTRFYGRLAGRAIVAPDPEESAAVHAAYVAMATAGVVTPAQREVFFAAGRRLCAEQGAEAVLLGGTDLFLAFRDADPGFEAIDVAEAHIAAIADAGLKS